MNILVLATGHVDAGKGAPHSHLSVLTYPMSPERKRIIGRAFFMSVV